MNKIIIKTFSVISLICILISLVACEKTPDETETSDNKYHTVTFNTNGGSPIESVKIESGKVLTRPADPVLDNYVFCRWEYNDVRWVFTESTITEDMTLNAIWVSAENLFGIDPVEGGGLSLKGLKKQEQFEWLNVPAMINGKTVVAVSDNAFEAIHESYTQHLILPDTVKSIGFEAFKDVSKTKITVNGVITSIGESAFERCSTIEKITLGKGIETIPFRAFSECVAISYIDIPDGVKVIDEDAFSGCSSLNTVVLPATISSIENAAFDGCSSLETIFFAGSEEQFDKISVAALNNAILDATVYFYSEQEPAESGAFWHYDKNNSPVVW